MSGFEEFDAEQARLCMLKELGRQIDRRSNEAVLERVLDSFGYKRSREWIRTQLLKMKEVGAIRITEVGSLMIAELTRAGLDHLDCRSVIEGIARPSPSA